MKYLISRKCITNAIMECSMLEFSILVSLIQIYFIISHITYLLYTLFHTVKYCRIVCLSLSLYAGLTGGRCHGDG